MSSAYTPAGTSEASAPWSAPDDNRQSFDCHICGRIGYESFPGAESFVDADDDRLDDAQKIPTNKWVCSAGCRSQAMFQAADEAQKEGLNCLAGALLAIDEHLDAGLRDFLGEWLPEPREFTALFLEAANRLRSSLAGGWEPDWLNRPTREEVMERAMHEAVNDLRAPEIRAQVFSEVAQGSGRDVTYKSEFMVSEMAGVVNAIKTAVVRLREGVR